MSHVVSSSAPITSAHTVKQYAGFGILGADIPTTGDNGGSPVLNDSPISTSEYHWRVETAPSAGVLTIYPDLTFEWDGTGVSDGSYPWVYRLFEDGVDSGTATVNQIVGAITLSIADALHAHAADNVALATTGSTSLAIADAIHGLSSDVIAFITGSYLELADSLHGHSADVITLATDSLLAVAEAIHSHAADNLTLDASNATPLTTQDSTHAHSADNNVFTLDTWLAIVESVHTHSADNVSISSEELLSVADALHSLASDALVLSLPSPPGTCPTAAEIAAAIIAAASITPIYADIRKVNNLSVNGSGTDGDPWGP